MLNKYTFNTDYMEMACIPTLMTLMGKELPDFIEGEALNEIIS